jgi:hypothetical protein
MRFDREVRRTVAQFLNGLGVALIATLVLAPVAAGAFHGVAFLAALVGAALAHLLALAICSGG